MNIQAIFQQIIDKITRTIKNFCIVYVDEILIHNKDLKEHIEHLKKFNYIARKNGLALSERKAEIVKTEIEFLGYIFIEKKYFNNLILGKILSIFQKKLEIWNI